MTSKHDAVDGQEGTGPDDPRPESPEDVEGLIGGTQQVDSTTSPDHPVTFADRDHLHNRSILEALLMASDAPLQIGRILPALEDAGPRDVRVYVDELNAEYENSDRSFRITEVAGGFQFAVETRFAPFVRRLYGNRLPVRLSQAALETLAIIGFKQPITRTEIEAIRGVSVDWVIKRLWENNLIRISGRAEGVGRPLLYGTTREFLQHFGLRTLADLPKMGELEELLKDREGESNLAERTAEPIPGSSGSGLETEERSTDPGGEGNGEWGGDDGPGEGDRS